MGPEQIPVQSLEVQQFEERTDGLRGALPIDHFVIRVCVVHGQVVDCVRGMRQAIAEWR
jgi:hypothetical protein